MSKLSRKWIQLDWTKSGVLRAQDIPFDASHSVRSLPGTANPSFQLDVDSGGPVLENAQGNVRLKRATAEPAGLEAAAVTQRAADNPVVPPTDAVTVYVTAAGDSPRTVKWACKLQDGTEVILASLVV